MDADYSALTEKIETNSKALEFKINHRVRISIRILNTKISEVEDKIPNNSKYITNQEFNKLAAENFASRIKHLVN